jgi:hypothetical protein
MLSWRHLNITNVETEIANPSKGGDAKPWIYIPGGWDRTARLPKLIPSCVCPDVPGPSTRHVLFLQDAVEWLIFRRIGTILLRKIFQRRISKNVRKV